MKTMRIGSSVINLDKMYDLNCEKCEDGVIVTVEYKNSEKEYLVPGFYNPENIAKAIHDGIKQSEHFDLISKCSSLARICDTFIGEDDD